jgi:hypothetical protein
VAAPLSDRPTPPAPVPLFRGTRPLKRWRYVGVFCEELMLCAARVQVGPAHQTFWALFTRADSRLRERTHTLWGRSRVELEPRRPGEPGRLRVNDGPVRVDLALEEDAGWETTCPNGTEYVWTRKQAGIRAHGTLAFDAAPPRPVEALAIVDDTAGYHARLTEWRWAAGVGVDPTGRPLAFNLVQGVNDPPTGSERAVWADGLPHEAPAVNFSADLTQIVAEDGSMLRFKAEAQRAHHENLLLVRSDYLAPFGTFSGALPGGIELARGLGVVEYHSARW